MNAASIRRFVFTLITGYLAIFGVQRLPYEFENQWAVLIPILIATYFITVALDGFIFKEGKKGALAEEKTPKRKKKTKKASTGFGSESASPQNRTKR